MADIGDKNRESSPHGKQVACRSWQGVVSKSWARELGLILVVLSCLLPVAGEKRRRSQLYKSPALRSPSGNLPTGELQERIPSLATTGVFAICLTGDCPP